MICRFPARLSGLAVTMATLLAVPALQAGVPEPGTLYLHQGSRGDVVAVTDTAGAPVERRRYGPWGNAVEQAGTVGERPGFTGMEQDGSTALHYFRARYYDARLGRFLSPDPLGQFRSPYLYAFDAPLAWVDPTGKGAEEYYSEVSPFRFMDGSDAVRLLIPHGDLETDVWFRHGYYFDSNVYLERGGQQLVAVLQRRPGSRHEANAIARRMSKNETRRYYTLVPLDRWQAGLAERSVVLIHVGHSRPPGFRSRISWVNATFNGGLYGKCLAWLDIGCSMHSVVRRWEHQSLHEFLAERHGITFISSTESVVSASYYGASPPGDGGAVTLSRRDVETYVRETVANYRADGLFQSWLYRVPTSQDFRVKRTPPGRDEMYHFIAPGDTSVVTYTKFSLEPGGGLRSERIVTGRKPVLPTGATRLQRFDFNYHPRL